MIFQVCAWILVPKASLWIRWWKTSGMVVRVGRQVALFKLWCHFVAHIRCHCHRCQPGDATNRQGLLVQVCVNFTTLIWALDTDIFVGWHFGPDILPKCDWNLTTRRHTKKKRNLWLEGEPNKVFPLKNCQAKKYTELNLQMNLQCGKEYSISFAE